MHRMRTSIGRCFAGTESGLNDVVSAGFEMIRKDGPALGACGEGGGKRWRELNRTDHWSEFMSRMRHQFEELLESKPTCLQDMLQELREHQDSITFLDIVRDSVPTVKDIDLTILPTQMQRLGYYASIQGPWLVCSKSKKQHDTMLFAAQAAQVLAAANMMLASVPTTGRTESSLAA